MRMIPMPEWTSSKQTGEYLCGEFVGWIYFVWQEMEQGRPVQPALMDDLTGIARAAGEFLASGEAPDPGPFTIAALSDLADEALTLDVRPRRHLDSKAGSMGENWPLFAKSLARGIKQLLEQKPKAAEVSA